jgi:hypothetical protein
VIADAVRQELADLRVDPESVVAVAALIMARHVDGSAGAGTSPLMRELNRCMAEVRAVAGRRPATVDELQVRRHQRPRGVPDDDR